jgi:hypothetical protein
MGGKGGALVYITRFLEADQITIPDVEAPDLFGSVQVLSSLQLKCNCFRNEDAGDGVGVIAFRVELIHEASIRTYWALAEAGYTSAFSVSGWCCNLSVSLEGVEKHAVTVNRGSSTNVS